jgi:enterochelin esterase-like enzyme
MQDGSNLFFPEEAFMNREWQVDESLQLLDEMNAADKCVVVGVHADDRMAEYTKPGYEAYARAVVDDLRPHVNRELLTLAAPGETGVMGSSLGGVVSFYMAWQHPDVFGFAGCLSSTFSHADDLIERVLTEPRRDLRVYLDSGWPGDNYEVTLAMAMALVARGAVYGKDVLHLSYPLAGHDEEAWASRLHVPVQFFTGKLSTAARGRFV